MSAIGDYTLVNGKLTIDGPDGQQAIDITDPEGYEELQKLEAQLSKEDKSEIDAMIAAAGYRIEEIAPGVYAYVPNDSYDGVGSNTGLDGSDGRDKDEVDEQVEEIFNEAGVHVNGNNNSEVQESAAFSDCVEATQNVIHDVMNGRPPHMEDFTDRMLALQQQFPDGNIMEMLYLVFRESIEELNEDKKYFLEKLEMYNTMGEGLSKYLDELTDASQELEENKKDASSKEADEKAEMTVKVTEKTMDFSTLRTDDQGNRVPAWQDSHKGSYNTTALANLMKDVEAMQETLRNKRQMAQTSFQNFDQKSNQVYNMLVQAVKTMQEMRRTGIKNML